MEKKCPDCGIPMIDERVEGAFVNACTACAGVWVHPEALTILLSTAGLIELEEMNVPASHQKSLGASLRCCPEDDMPLDNYHYCYNSTILLQVCSDCGGFWIVDGQLKQMQEWLNLSNRPITKQDEHQLALAQFNLEHENYMTRQENLQKMFEAMRRFRPGWIA